MDRAGRFAQNAIEDRVLVEQLAERIAQAVEGIDLSYRSRISPDRSSISRSNRA